MSSQIHTLSYGSRIVAHRPEPSVFILKPRDSKLDDSDSPKLRISASSIDQDLKSQISEDWHSCRSTVSVPGSPDPDFAITTPELLVIANSTSKSTIRMENSTEPITYFGGKEIQYGALTDDGDIEMAQFLRGCNGIVEFVGFLGALFSPVKEDISGNIGKVERVYQTDVQKYASVMKMLDAEIIDWPGRMGPATEGLLYIKRALEFLCIFLDLLVIDHRSGKKSSSLVCIGKTAYDRSLKKHHKTTERLLFKVVIHATPWRRDLLKTVASGRPNAEDECVRDIERYLKPMKSNVDRLMQLYKELGYEK